MDLRRQTYTRDRLLSFRFTARTIVRSVRKRLFQLRLWRPFAVGMPTHRPAALRERRFTYVLRDCMVTPLRHPHNFIPVATINAHSVRNKSAILLDILQQYNLDVFAITETWHEDANDIALKRIVPSGYSCVEAARTPRRPATSRF